MATVAEKEEQDLNPLSAAEKALGEARDARDAHLSTTQPNEFEGELYEQWIGTRDELNAAVDQRETEFGEQIDQAPAQQLSGFAGLLASRRGNGGNEQAAAQEVQSVEDDWTPSQDRGQVNNRGAAGRGYANYAATAQNEHENQQTWEQREHNVRQANLGQGSLTVEQIEAQEQQAAQPQQRSEEEIAQAARDEQDWNARFLRGR